MWRYDSPLKQDDTNGVAVPAVVVEALWMVPIAVTTTVLDVPVVAAEIVASNVALKFVAARRR